MSAGGAEEQASSSPPPASAGFHDTPDANPQAHDPHTSHTSDDRVDNSEAKHRQDQDSATTTNPPRPQEEPSSEATAAAASHSGKPASIPTAVGDKHAQPPPLPDEEPPPLPNESVPQSAGQQDVNSDDDGWQPVWDAGANAYYFYNRFSHATQWENPRVPNTHAGTATVATPASNHDRIPDQPQYAPGTEPAAKSTTGVVAGGYNPAIHGDYDPNADYAQLNQDQDEEQPLGGSPPGLAGTDSYASTASFNRYTGRFNNTSIHPTHTPDQHTDEAKSRRQMSAFFDVDAAANAHGGRSLKAERQERRLSKRELQQFQARRRARKEEKRRAWLRD